MGKKILMIDDSEDNLLLYSAMLKKEESINLTTSNRGKKGLQLISQEDFDLVLLDIHMPEMNGVDTLKAIREYEKKNKKEKTRVIALTGSTMDSEVKEILDAGFDKHLAKPVRKQVLIDSILEAD